MANYTVALTPSLINMATEGSMDSSIINGVSIQRTMSDIMVLKDSQRKIIGRLADGQQFDDAIETSIPNTSIGFKTFSLAWDGSHYENSATATGVININVDILKSFGNNYTDFGANAISSLEITITNASSGNGTFTLADFEFFAWWDFFGLDFNQQLVGQNGWGTPDSSSGDFNLFTTKEGAPQGEWYFSLGTNNGNGDLMLLTSFMPL